MKFEALVYVVVACLTLAVPGTAYISISSKLQMESDNALERAQRLERTAKGIEDGTIKIYVESIPTAMRIQANGEKHLSSMYLNYKSATDSFFSAALRMAGLQILLLIFILIRRRHITQRSNPPPNGAA